MTFPCALTVLCVECLLANVSILAAGWYWHLAKSTAVPKCYHADNSLNLVWFWLNIFLSGILSIPEKQNDGMLICFLKRYLIICRDMSRSTVLTKQNLFFFVAGKPQSIESSERVQLSGTYNVRKGKLQLPVNRWTRRQVILCGTCLIVSSVKDSQTGKMHILPLIGGKVCLSHSATGLGWHHIIFISYHPGLLWWWRISYALDHKLILSYQQRVTW